MSASSRVLLALRQQRLFQCAQAIRKPVQFFLNAAAFGLGGVGGEDKLNGERRDQFLHLFAPSRRCRAGCGPHRAPIPSAALRPLHSARRRLTRDDFFLLGQIDKLKVGGKGFQHRQGGREIHAGKQAVQLRLGSVLALCAFALLWSAPGCAPRAETTPRRPAPAAHRPAHSPAAAHPAPKPRRCPARFVLFCHVKVNRVYSCSVSAV